MKIQELENELNISRANIRFYEKEGLLNPKRKENGYRNYSDDDIAILKKIIIYRKLGISVADIKKIFNGEADLQEAVSQSIENLQKEIENLNGSIKLCKEIQNSNTDNHSFDEENYWEKINSSEANGNKFVDICKDYLEFEREILYTVTDFYLPFYKYCLPDNLSKKQKNIRFLLAFLGMSIAIGIFCLLFGNFTPLKSFYYPVSAFVLVNIFALPGYFLKRKHPNLVSIYVKFLDIAEIIGAIGTIGALIYFFYILFSI